MQPSCLIVGHPLFRPYTLKMEAGVPLLSVGHCLHDMTVHSTNFDSSNTNLGNCYHLTNNISTLSARNVHFRSFEMFTSELLSEFPS
jgi:hypothetical protein